MIECGSLEFAQARLQARHGQRADELSWQRLEIIREFPALLDVARASPLRPWLVGITQDSPPHRIEAVLRSHWRAHVAEVAAWMPRPWQPALQWCALLPDLPVLQHLLHGGTAVGWMRQDPDYRALCDTAPGMHPAERAAAWSRGPFGPLFRALPRAPDEAESAAAPHPLAQAWLDEWRRRAPRSPEGAQETLGQLQRLLRAHGTAFEAAPAGQQAWLLRRSLQARLALLLRRSTLEPAAAFIHLALCALDLERLRGELLSRALFPHARVA
jgi:hypothetical protein